MAVTTPTSVASSIPMKYAQRVLAKSIAKTFWNGSVSGPGGGGALIQQAELLNKPGEEITIQVTSPLTGAGVEGDTTALTGSEEEMTTSAITFKTIYRRHGVRINNRAQKKSMLELRGQATARLSEWGQGKLDGIRFGTAINAGFYFSAAGAEGTEAAGGTPYVRYVGTGNANVDALIAAEIVTLAELSKTKYLMLDRLAKPWTVGGNDYVVAVLDPWAEYGIKASDTNWNAAQVGAQARGTDNPLFTGAVGVWDGVIIKTATRVFSANNVGVVRYAKNLMYGQEAFIEGWGTMPDWNEESFDYDLEHGFAYGFDYGCRRGFEVNSTQLIGAAPKAV